MQRESLHNVKPTRIRPTKSVEHQVREECGQACANPACREWSTASHEIHHIDGDRSCSLKTNLILLCGTCHNKEKAGVISEADVRLWKRMAEAGALPPPKGQAPAATVLMRDNYGIAAETVKIDTVKIQRESGAKGRREITPGLIEADADMRTYADYLVKKYIDWRKKGAAKDKRPFAAGSAHGIRPFVRSCSHRSNIALSVSKMSRWFASHSSRNKISERILLSFGVALRPGAVIPPLVETEAINLLSWLIASNSNNPPDDRRSCPL
jgi:hypothetical protein